jgi:hypothetical protein
MECEIVKTHVNETKDSPKSDANKMLTSCQLDSLPWHLNG